MNSSSTLPRTVRLSVSGSIPARNNHSFHLDPCERSGGAPGAPARAAAKVSARRMSLSLERLSGNHSSSVTTAHAGVSSSWQRLQAFGMLKGSVFSGVGMLMLWSHMRFDAHGGRSGAYGIRRRS